MVSTAQHARRAQQHRRQVTDTCSSTHQRAVQPARERSTARQHQRALRSRWRGQGRATGVAAEARSRCGLSCSSGRSGTAWLCSGTVAALASSAAACRSVCSVCSDSSRTLLQQKAASAQQRPGKRWSHDADVQEIAWPRTAHNQAPREASRAEGGAATASAALTAVCSPACPSLAFPTSARLFLLLCCIGGA